MTTVDFLATQPEDSPTRPRLVVSRPGPRPTPEPKAPPISNARLAVVMLIVAESMFFAGLIGAYLVFRFGKAVWPPVGLPALPIYITWVNTFVLMASAMTMWNATQAARAQQTPRLRRFILATIGLGIAFVAVQGFEWVQLVRHGLTVSSGPYGTTFFTLIGCHAAHVGVGLLWLGTVGIGVGAGWITRGIDVLVETCGIYWGFVCILWLVLLASSTTEHLMFWVRAYRMRRLPAVLVAWAAAIVLQPSVLFAQGCAMCRTMLGGPGDPLGVGMNTSILFMMAMPFVMTGSVGAWIAYMYWRGGRDERTSAHQIAPCGEEIS